MIMKRMKIYKLLIILLLLVGLNSCSGWLDLEPKDTTTETDLFQTGDGYRIALNGIYEQMAETSLYGKELSWGFLDVLAQMGCTVTEKADGIEVTGPAEDTLKGIEIDMNDFSDQALTLAAMAPFCKSDVHITHIGHIRGQECDRLHAMSEELTKRGITCTEEPDAITIKPGIPSAGIVSTYEDHRVAMSFALLGLKVDGIVIDNPSCCRKTFENYFDLLDQLSGKDR